MNKTKNRSTGLLALCAAMLLAQGCGAGWRVVRSSGEPSALKGFKKVAVQFDYSELLVEGRTEQEWISEKTAEKPEYVETWNELIGKYEDGFVNSFREQVGGTRILGEGEATSADEVKLVVKMRTLKMGKYIVIGASDTLVDAALVWVVEGKDGDEIHVRAASRHSIYKPSVFQHITPVSRNLGTKGGRFLRSKQSK